MTAEQLALVTQDEQRAWDMYAAACLVCDGIGAEDAAITADELVWRRRKRFATPEPSPAYAELLAAAEAAVNARGPAFTPAMEHLAAVVRTVKGKA